MPKTDMKIADTATNRAAIARALKVATVVAKRYNEPTKHFFIADHHHEGFLPGAATVACDGMESNWPWEWSNTDEARALEISLGLRFEAVNACTLAIFQDK